VVVVVGAEVTFIVELARVAFVAYFAVEEADGGGEGVVSLGTSLAVHERERGIGGLGDILAAL
jgi:hypothetical protein